MHKASRPGEPDARDSLPTLRHSGTMLNATVQASWTLRIVLPLSLAILILITFVPALDAGLVHWDDDDLLLLNTRHQNLNWESLRWMFTTSYTGHFQPLTWLSYALDWQLWKREAFGFHLTNVLLHIANSIAFYLVTCRLLCLTLNHSTHRRSAPVIASAALAAAFFALHPLRAESVCWLAERRDVLAGLFFLLSINAYLRYCDSQRRDDSTRVVRRHRSPAPYVLSVGFFALSLLSKASAVTMPAALLILDVYPLRRWRPTKHDQHSSVFRLLIEKTPFLLLAAAAGTRALIAQRDAGALTSLRAHSLLDRAAQMCIGLVFYIEKTLWPFNLGPLYEIPRRGDLFGVKLGLCVVGLLLIVGMAARYWRHRPAIAITLLSYFVLVIPVIGLFQSGPQLMADRYSYLACLPFAILVGSGMLQLLRRNSITRNPSYRALLTLLVAVGLAFGVKSTYAQSEYWLSPLTLWNRGVVVCPESSIAHTNYADALTFVELYEEAHKHYRRALRINPNDAVAHRHLAVLLSRYGDVRGVIHHGISSLAVDPNHPETCILLAQAFLRIGQAQRAMDVLRDGARRDPSARALIEMLAQVLSAHPDANIRQPQEAIRWAKHLLELRGHRNTSSLITLATAYASNAQFAKAVQVAEEGLRQIDEKTLPSIANELRRRLHLFRDEKPFINEP